MWIIRWKRTEFSKRRRYKYAPAQSEMGEKEAHTQANIHEPKIENGEVKEKEAKNKRKEKKNMNTQSYYLQWLTDTNIPI